MEKKQYVKVKIGISLNTDEMSMDKMIERSGEMAEKKWRKSLRKKNRKNNGRISKNQFSQK